VKQPANFEGLPDYLVGADYVQVANDDGNVDFPAPTRAKQKVEQQ
jgi:hypothetical protein